MQRRAPEGLRGRVLAATEAAEQAAFALGMVAGGAVVALVGPQAAYLVPAGMLALGALLVGMTDVPATPPTPRCSVT